MKGTKAYKDLPSLRTKRSRRILVLAKTKLSTLYRPKTKSSVKYPDISLSLSSTYPMQQILPLSIIVRLKITLICKSPAKISRRIKGNVFGI